MDRMSQHIPSNKQVPFKASHEARSQVQSSNSYGKESPIGKDNPAKLSKESIKDSIRAELKLYKSTLGKTNGAPIERSQSPGVQTDIFARLSSFKQKEMKRPSSAKPVHRP